MRHKMSIRWVVVETCRVMSLGSLGSHYSLSTQFSLKMDGFKPDRRIILSGNLLFRVVLLKRMTKRLIGLLPLFSICNVRMLNIPMKLVGKLLVISWGESLVSSYNCRLLYVNHKFVSDRPGWHHVWWHPETVKVTQTLRGLYEHWCLRSGIPAL